MNSRHNINSRLGLGQRWWVMHSQARRRRRAFSPKNVPGLKLWVGVESLAGTPEGTGVSVWQDQSGIGNDLAQATGLLKPIYRQSVNGSPAMDFGQGERMATTGNVLVTDRFVVMAVGRPTDTSESDAVGTGGVNTGDTLLMCYSGVIRGH